MILFENNFTKPPLLRFDNIKIWRGKLNRMVKTKHLLKLLCLIETENWKPQFWGQVYLDSF